MWTTPMRSAAVGPASSDTDLSGKERAGRARPLVRVQTGVLRGRRKRTKQGADYFSFMGIPYAAPPVGDLRFKAPVPAQPWSGVREADGFGPQCIQPLLIPPLLPNYWSLSSIVAHIKAVPALLSAGWRGLTCNEDCLYANVYTPQLPKGGEGQQGAAHPRLPVLVFVHGGGFRFGDGTSTLYGPEYLMDNGGVVLVTFNYRLGPFGFLATGTAEAPGNAGLKDQTMVLRWVRDNIAAFGGDPGCVTLYGESAGAVSAHMHCLSPLSRGLFHRVIASSNLVPSDWALEERPLQHARAFAKALGVADEDLRDPDTMVRRLRAMPATSLQRVYNHMHCIFTPRLTLGMVFVPVVEPAAEGAFLPEDPETVLAEGRQADVPLMTGSNDREELILSLGFGDGVYGEKSASVRRAFMEEALKHRPECLLPNDLHHALRGQDQERAAVARDVVQHYFGDAGIRLDKYQQFAELMGDTQFVLPVLKGSRKHAATGTAPVYYYFFNHDGNFNSFKHMMKLMLNRGASHADEMGFIFRGHVVAPSYQEPDSRDAACKANMLALWTNFVKTGNPTPPGSLGIEWIPRTEHCLHYLEINDSLTVKSGMLYDRLRFWNNIYKKYLNLALF